MKIIIIGGHLTPALSVIEELEGKADILYVGRKHAIEGDKAVSLEYTTILEKNISFAEIKTGRFQRSLTRHTFPSVIKIPGGFLRAVLILKKFKPDVVVGFGGYVSVPVALAAKALRIPVVIHEQTLEAGGANRFISKFADKICISFDTSLKYFPKEKVVLTGNPVGDTIHHPGKRFPLDSKDPVIYVTGGSQGSHFINHLISQTLAKLLDKYILIHQTGDSREFKDFDKLTILKEGLNNGKRDRYIISKFYSPYEVGAVMKRADLVISRAGINTISELIVLEKPSYLIPLPISQKDEQLKNAEFLKKLGLGEVGNQKSLTPDTFLREVTWMMENIVNYKIKHHKSHFPKNAAAKIVEVIYAAETSN